MPEQPAIHVGQIWEETRGDLKGRRLKVIAADPYGFSMVECVRNADDVRAALDGNPKAEWAQAHYTPNNVLGRRTHMRTTSLRPPRFRLLTPAEVAG